MISSILDFSRIETGHLDMRWADVAPREVVEAAVTASEEMATRRGARLAVNVPDDLPVVSLDRERVITAVKHLIDNAVKFSPPGGVVRVSAKVSTTADEEAPEDGFGYVLLTAPEMLEISVEDFGVGIAEIDQERSSPHSPSSTTPRRAEHGGSGLGLAVVST